MGQLVVVTFSCLVMVATHLLGQGKALQEVSGGTTASMEGTDSKVVGEPSQAAVPHGIVCSDWMKPEFQREPYDFVRGNLSVWLIKSPFITKEIVENGSVMVYSRRSEPETDGWISPLPMYDISFTNLRYVSDVSGGGFDPPKSTSVNQKLVANVVYWEYSLAVGTIRLTTNYHSDDYHQYRYVIIPSGAYARQQLSATARKMSTFKEIDVAADVLWVDTGVLLKEGEPFSIEADGTWSNSGHPAIGPEGFKDFVYPGTIHTSASLGSLVGRVGDIVFAVGKSFSGSTRGTGKLYLAMNDTPESFADNQGKLRVKIHTMNE